MTLAIVSLFGKFIFQFSYQIVFISACNSCLYKISRHQFSGSVDKQISVHIGRIAVGSRHISVFVRHLALLNFFATAEGVQSYMVWGLGNFGGVSLQQMPAFALVTVAGLFGSLLLIKPLNALLLGERYAENLGINIRYVRNWLLVITGLLTAITTAFCGPVAFIGLAVPHIARMVLRI